MQRAHRRPVSVSAILLSFCFFTNIAVGQSAERKAQLYFFTNAACGPCRLVEPEIEKLYRNGYAVMKIDTHLHPDWAARFGITKTPTVVLAVGDEVVARKSGFVDAATLQQWFMSASPKPRGQLDRAADAGRRSVSINPSPTANAPTRGFFRPESEAERKALQATVRLKIDDPKGTSYATGTVIHSRDNECLVLTCGHVFRDSNGTGTISAEYGFADNQVRTANGELLFYDADERDIGLVAIRTAQTITPISVASTDYKVERGATIFSLGCDQGSRPSIRRSKIKNQAKYDGVVKYEIFGRPVNGRSGGGLFTSDGKLVGVCNAAVVDVDEGVYVALDTIHWQFDKVNLAHLFDQNSNASAIRMNENPARRSRLADVSPRPREQGTQLAAATNNGAGRDFSTVPIRDPRKQPAFNSIDESVRPLPKTDRMARMQDGSAAVTTPVVDKIESQQNATELIVVLRDRNSKRVTDSWTVDNPGSELIHALRGSESDESFRERQRMAQLRKDMPNLQTAQSRIYNSHKSRAQSPR